MSKKLVLSIIGLVFLAAGVIAGIYLVQQQQLLQKDAAVPDGVVSATLNPSSSSNIPLGTPHTVGVSLHNLYGQTNILNTTLSLRLRYTPDSSGSPIIPYDPEPSQFVKDDPDTGWSVSTKYKNDDGNGTITYTISLFATNHGYTIPENGVHVADFTFAFLRDAQVTLELDPTQSTVNIASGTSGDYVDTLRSPLPVGTYQTSGSVQPSPTQSIQPSPTQGTQPSPTQGTAPSPTQGVQPSPTLTQGAVPSPTPTGGTGGTNPTPTRTPTPTTGSGGGTQPTATPTTASGTGTAPSPTPTTVPASTSPGIRPITISSPQNGAVLTDTTPTFTGIASSNASIAITITGPTTLNGSTGADANGNWTWTTPSPLAGGSYTAQLTATDQQGGVTNASVSFSISTAAGATQLPQAGNATYTLLLLFLGSTLLAAGLLTTKKMA